MLITHMASFVAWQLAMYSASILEVATVACFFELHEMALCPKEKRYPEMEWWLSTSAPQAESMKPCNLISPGLLSTRVWLRVVYKYSPLVLRWSSVLGQDLRHIGLGVEWQTAHQGTCPSLHT